MQEGTIKLLDVSGGRVLASFDAYNLLNTGIGRKYALFSTDGSELIVAQSPTTLLIVRSKTGEIKRRIEFEESYSILPFLKQGSVLTFSESLTPESETRISGTLLSLEDVTRISKLFEGMGRNAEGVISETALFYTKQEETSYVDHPKTSILVWLIPPNIITLQQALFILLLDKLVKDDKKLVLKAGSALHRIWQTFSGDDKKVVLQKYKIENGLRLARRKRNKKPRQLAGAFLA